MAMTPAEIDIFNALQRIYADGIRRDAYEEGTITYSYDEIRAKVWSMLWENVREGAAQLIVQTVTELGAPEWERFLSIPVDETLPISIRRANILAKLAGNPCTIGVLKRVITSIIDNPSVDFDILEFFRYTPDYDTIFWYNIVFFDSTLVIDMESLRATLDNIHPAHCRLNTIAVIDDYWEWDNDLKPLDDPRFGTGMARLPNLPGTKNDLYVESLQDGNQFQLNGFIDSIAPRYGLYARQMVSPGPQVRIEGGTNINVAGARVNMDEQIVNISFYSGVVLLYAYYEGGVKFDVVHDTEFTVGDPETYFEAVPSRIIRPIAEIDMTSGGNISQDMIKDVRAIF